MIHTADNDSSLAYRPAAVNKAGYGRETSVSASQQGAQDSQAGQDALTMSQKHGRKVRHAEETSLTNDADGAIHPQSKSA